MLLPWRLARCVSTTPQQQHKDALAYALKAMCTLRKKGVRVAENDYRCLTDKK